MRLFRTLLFLTSALSGVLSDSCDCDHKNSRYHHGYPLSLLLESMLHRLIYLSFRGCVISESAPKGKACKCISGGVRCDGEITECIDPSSKYCQSPDDRYAQDSKIPVEIVSTTLTFTLTLTLSSIISASGRASRVEETAMGTTTTPSATGEASYQHHHPLPVP